MRKVPKDTKYFKYYNCNPKDKFGCDCAIRAVAAYFDIDWVEAINSMTATGIKYGYVLNDPHCIDKHLKTAGLTKQKEPRDIYNKKISVREWLRMNPGVSCIANVGSHHMTVILKGKVYDTWDCSNKTMHSYWS